MSLRIINVGEEPGDGRFKEYFDPNGGRWSIVLVGDAWVTQNERPDEGTPGDDARHAVIYPGKVAIDDQEREISGQRFKLTWLPGALPMMTGKTASGDPKKAIDAFARQNKAIAEIVVRGKPGNTPSSGAGLLVVLAIIAIAWYADKPKRGRR